MDPMTISAILMGGKAAYELGTGISQGIKGKKLGESAVRPQYQIPKSAQTALGNAEAMAASSMFPGQQRAEESIYGATSQALNSAKEASGSSADFLAGISGVAGAEQEALGGLATKALEYQDVNKQRLNEALMSMAGYEDKQFDLNQYQPFLDKANAARSLKQASRENISNAFGNAAKTGAILAGEDASNQKSISPGYYTPNSPANPNYTAPKKFEPWNPEYKQEYMMMMPQ